MAQSKERDKSAPEREILPRTVKWEIDVRKRPELERFLVRISNGLREYEHWALEEKNKNYMQRKKTDDLIQEGAIELFKAELEGKTQKLVRIKGRNEAALYPKSFLTDFDLYNRYMTLRKADEEAGSARAGIPANWVLESCFRKVSAAYKSWFELLRRGDQDAHAIKPSDEWKFVAIQGALTPSSVKRIESFSAGRGYVSGRYLVLAPKIFPAMLEFEIPEAHQAPLLANAKRLAKFVISRRKSDLRRPGRYWVSVTYEIEKPEAVPFVPEDAVYIALGASSIGIVSPRGEETIPLWRSDKHWKPKTDAIESSCSRKATKEEPFPIQKGSRRWRKLQEKRNKMFETMARQQTQDRREVVAIDLIQHLTDTVVCGHGLHFVVTEYDIRSKKDKLADASKPERSGPLGLNWMAQNTGTIGYLGQWLEVKVAEFGGAVHWHRLPHEALPKHLGVGHENKILVARALRDHFLKTYKTP